MGLSDDARFAARRGGTVAAATEPPGGPGPPAHPGHQDGPHRAVGQWTTFGEALAVILYRPHLRRTLTTAIVVGVLLFGINQLDVVVRGEATAATWLKGALTPVVPFLVSNLGLLTATDARNGPRQRELPDAQRRAFQRTRP